MNPSRHEHTFTLKDRWGDVHTYTVAHHQPAEGQQVMFTLLGWCSGSLAPLLSTILGFEGSLKDLLSDEELARALQGVDFAVVGQQVRQILASGQAPKMVSEILRFTVRDQKPLSLDQCFNDAYRGNYLEMLEAAWEVIDCNGFLPISTIVDRVSLAGESPPQAT